MAYISEACVLFSPLVCLKPSMLHRPRSSPLPSLPLDFSAAPTMAFLKHKWTFLLLIQTFPDWSATQDLKCPQDCSLFPFTPFPSHTKHCSRQAMLLCAPVEPHPNHHTTRTLRLPTPRRTAPYTAFPDTAGHSRCTTYLPQGTGELSY